jgi:hypothetical protein
MTRRCGKNLLLCCDPRRYSQESEIYQYSVHSSEQQLQDHGKAYSSFEEYAGCNVGKMGAVTGSRTLSQTSRLPDGYRNAL